MGVHIVRMSLKGCANVNVQGVKAGVGLSSVGFAAAHTAPMQRLWVCYEGTHLGWIDDLTGPRIESAQFASVHAAQLDDEALGGQNVDARIDAVHKTDLAPVR